MLLAAANIDPAGRARFSGTIPVYISTHPNLDERIAKARMLADQAGITPPRLLQEYDWLDISNICGTTGSKLNP